jgi:hypothetical protein
VVRRKPGDYVQVLEHAHLTDSELPMRRRLIPLILLSALVLVGCGGNDSNSSSQAGTASTAASAGASATPTACPTENTRSFAKTRFVADVGGAAFLVKRYIYTPYKGGKFQKGANGRTFALVKAGLTAAASAKLLKNAKENAQANPTLCRTIAGPLSTLTSQLSGLVSSLRSGSFDPAVVGGLGGALDGVKSLADKAGIPIPEQSAPLR